MKLVLLLFSAFCVAYAENTEESGQNHGHNHSNHLDCFDEFIPLINRLANEAKETSGSCIAAADVQKDRELASINRTRTDLYSEVKRIKETLSTCSTQNDHLGYFDCLKGIVETDRKIVGDISMKSSRYSNKIKEIEELMIKCFRNSVIKVKQRSSNAMQRLEFCLTSGESAKNGDTSTTKMFHHTTPAYSRNQWNY